MLWTHKGVSGPTALGVSREIAEAIHEDSLIEADVLPDEPRDALTERLMAHCKQFPRRAVSDFIEAIVPNRLVIPLMTAAEADSAVRGAYLTQKERNRLVGSAQRLESGPRPPCPSGARRSRRGRRFSGRG